jgi:hypothetical protein
MDCSITKADLKKYKGNIVDLWKRNFQDASEERYPWIYEDNPSGSVSCWVMGNSNENSVLGSVALFPRRMSINSKSFLAGVAGDFTMDEMHRALGPALSLQKTSISYCNDGHFDMLYSFPNMKSEPVLRRAGYKVLGDIVRLSKPLKSYYQLKKYVDIPIVTRIFSKAVDLTMKIFSSERQYKRPGRYSSEILTLFDERFDRLWEKVSSRYSIIAERSSTYLNWRFINSPHQFYNVFALTENEGRNVLGYIVYHIIENISNIDDILCIDMDGTLGSLLSEFLLFQRREGMYSVSITYTGTDIFIRKLKEYGFSERERERKILIYIPSDSPNRSYLMEKENWYLFPCDNDI